jgi:hypothetical protein
LCTRMISHEYRHAIYGGFVLLALRSHSFKWQHALIECRLVNFAFKTV